MVGHTGKLTPAVSAMETIDACIGRIIDAAAAGDVTVFITADHGNCETMIDPVTGQPHTAHTTNPIPFIAVSRNLVAAQAARRREARRRRADHPGPDEDRAACRDGRREPVRRWRKGLMSIGRRLIDLARAELNSLLDKAARSDDDDNDENYGERHRAQRDAASMSDDELAAEIERRRQAREEVEAAIRGGRRASSAAALAPALGAAAPDRRGRRRDPQGLRRARGHARLRLRDRAAIVPAADAQVPPRPPRRLARKAARRDRSDPAFDRRLQDARAPPAQVDGPR